MTGLGGFALRRAAGTDTGRRLLFRALVVGCQAATIMITWQLWAPRQQPPLLPILSLPLIHMGPLLLLSLGVVLVRPRVGIALHAALLGLAMIADQTRVQPEVVSLTVLMVGTLPHRSAQSIARAHLIALWLWAGANKLLSPDFFQTTAPWMLDALVRDAPSALGERFGWVIVALETGTGVLAVVPRTRRIAAWSALALHGGILLVLSPIGHNWNQAIWPWNVALAAAGFALIAPWREDVPVTLRQMRWPVRAAVVVVLLSPAGYYVGVTDAYLAHNLYSSNTPRTYWCDTANVCNPDRESRETLAALRVPLPPERRLYHAYFRDQCAPGEQLIIDDSRWWMRRRGEGRVTLPCERVEIPPIFRQDNAA